MSTVTVAWNRYRSSEVVVHLKPLTSPNTATRAIRHPSADPTSLERVRADPPGWSVLGVPMYVRYAPTMTRRSYVVSREGAGAAGPSQARPYGVEKAKKSP